MKKDIHLTMTIRRLAAAISCLATVFFAFPAQLHAAAGGSLDWEYWNNDSGNQMAVSSVLDSEGNIIITGTSNKNGTDDFYTIKIKADHSGVLWSSTYDLAGGSDRAVAVAVDGDDNVIITGVGNRSGVKKEMVTIKYCGKDVGTPPGYDPEIPGTPYPGLCTAGEIIWTATYDGPARGNDYPTSLAVDADKNIYVGGYGQSLSGGDDDYILLKYAPAGPSADGSPTWQRSYGGGRYDNDYITDVATCGSGQNLFVAVTGHIFDPSTSRIHTIKYSSAGTQLWEKTLSTKVKVNEVAPKIAMDSACNVVVSGSVVGSGSNDIYTIKYASANGQESWNQTYAGSGDDQLNDVYIDKNNDVFLAGMTYVTLQDDNFYTARLNGSTGVAAWEKLYDSGYWDAALSLAVDNATSSVYVLGVTLDNNNDYDFRTIKYRLADGNLLWNSPFDSAVAAGGSQNDWPIGITLNAAGEILVTGYIDAVVTGISFDYYAVKYVPGLLDPPTDLVASARSETKVALTWADNSGNETGFEIHRSTASFEMSNDSRIATVAADVKAYNDSTVLANTRYYYRVRAKEVVGSVTNLSHSSNQVTTVTTILNYPVPAWLFTYNGTGNANDEIGGIAVGPDRNPVVTGAGVNDMHYTNYLTMKLDRSNDSRVLWYDYHDYVFADLDISYDVAIASDNGIIITGTANLFANGSKSLDIKTIAFNATGPEEGEPLWSYNFDNAAYHGVDSGKIVAYSSATNSWAMAGFGDGINGTDIFVAKFDRSGNPLWSGGVKTYNSGSYDYPSGMIFDANGDLLVTGICNGSGDVSSGAFDILLMKFNGSTGDKVWADKTYNHAGGDDRSTGIALDGNNDIYLTGYVTNDSSKNFYTAKYSGSTGTRLWHKTYNGPANGDDTAEAIAFDSNNDGEVIVGGTRLSATNNHDFYLVRYDAKTGAVEREITLDREFDDDFLKVMGTDLSGSMCVVGATGSTNIDLIGVRYDWDGKILGSMKYNGAGNDIDMPIDVATNTYGEIFVAGKTKNLSNNLDYLVLKCEGSVVQAPSPFNLTKYYTSVDLSWQDTNTDESGFEIERDKKACLQNDSQVMWDNKLIKTASANATSFTDLGPDDLGLDINQTYCYRIRTTRSGKDPSRWLYGQITTYNPPKPTNLATAKLNTTGIKLDWSDNTNGETDFIVERCEGLNCSSNDSNFAIVGYADANAQTWNDLSVCEGTTYSYKIRAQNTNSNTWVTNDSNTSANVATDAKATLTNLKAAKSSEGRINLSWTDSNPNETGFKIYRCQNDSCASFQEMTSLMLNPTDAKAFYHLDNARYTGIANEVLDSSGNGYHATANKAESVPAGIKGRAVYFSGNDSYLSTNLIVDQSSAASKLTMAAWVYPASTSAGYHYVISSDNGGWDWAITREGSVWEVFTGDNKADTGFTVDVNTWQHIAAVYQNGTVIFYKNGQPSASFNTSPEASSNTLAIGSSITYPGYFDGKIDEVAIYDRALTPDELSVLYNNHLSDANPDRAVYLKMDESSWSGAASEVKDRTVNQVHGQSFNGANTISDTTRGQVANFDGTNDYVNLGTPAALQATGSQTIAFWVSPDSFSSRRNPYSKAYGGEGALTIETTGQVNYYYGISGANSGTYQTFAMTSALTAGTWTHLAIVRDLAAMKLRWYKNGVMVNEATASYSAAVASSLPAYIGYGFTTNYFDGKLDEFMIMNHALSTSEIAGIYNQTIPTSYSDTNVLPNTTYRYQISAFNNDSCRWETSHTAIISNDSALATPTTLSATVLSTTKVNLSWQDKFEFENNYILQRCDATQVANCDNDSDFNVSYTFGPTVTSYNDSTVLENRTYAFRVKATNTTTESWDSAYSNVVTPLINAKAVPYDFNVSRVNEEDILLTWTTANTDQDGFQVYRSLNDSCTSYTLLKTLAPGVSTYTDKHLGLNSTYCYQVLAFKNLNLVNQWTTAYAALVGGGSNQATTTVYGSAINTAVATSSTTINLGWNDSTGHETDYIIQRCTMPACDEGDFVQIGAVGQSVTSYIDTSSAICKDSTYKYRVRAEDNGLSNGLDSCWLKKKKINFTNFIANYPMLLEIPWDSNMQPDFDDIRFYDETYQHEIPYWLVSKTDSSKAYVWIMTGENNNIYLYHKNANAVSASDPSSVAAFTNSDYYEFFDNFVGRRSSIGSSKWVEIDGNNKITQDNDLLLNYFSTDSWDSALISQETFTRQAGKTVNAGITALTRGTDYFMLGWDLNQTSNASYTQLVHGLYFNNGQFRAYEKGGDKGYKNLKYYDRGGYDYEIDVRLTDTGASYWVRGGGGSYNYSSTWNEIETENNYTDSTMRLAFHQRSHMARVNWVAVKVRPATEPTYAFAAATDTSCPTAHIWTGAFSPAVSVTTPPASAPTNVQVEPLSASALNVSWDKNSTDEDVFYLQRCDRSNANCPVENDSIFTTAATINKTSYVTSAIPPELALYFDEASWTGVPNQIIDSSGKGVNSTAFGGASTVIDEVRGQVGKFDGSDDYVEIPGTGSLQNTTDSSYTFAAWVKPANAPAATDLNPPCNNCTYGILMRPGNHTGLMYTSDKRFSCGIWNSTPSYFGVSSSATYAPGFWHQVVGVVDDSQKKIFIYVDGALQNQTTYTGTLRDFGTISYYVGTGTIGNTYNYFYEGLIDEPRIFNKALSASEVQTLYAPSTYSYTDPGLIPGSTHSYRVKAAKSSGNCDWSLVSTTATATTQQPPEPDNFTAVLDPENGYGAINLAWRDRTGTNNGFIVERSESTDCNDSGAYAEIATVYGNDTTYSDAIACPGASYCYRVKGVNEVFPIGYGLSNNGGNTQWSRRKTLTITNFQANYQTKLEIAWDPDMQENFADIRFYDATASQELSYWIENQSNSTSATVWVKTGANNNIILYYGNPNASSSSNGNNVFSFFDDFDDSVIDPVKWPTKNTGSYISETGGELKITQVNGNTYYIQSLAFTGTASPPFVLTARTKSITAPANGWSPVMWYKSTSEGMSILDYPPTSNRQVVRLSGSWAFFTPDYIPLDQWHQNSVILKTTTSMAANVEFETATNKNWSYSNTTSTPTGSNNFFIKIGPRHDGTYYAQENFDGRVDWVFMRKWVATEPTVSVGSEERGAFVWETSYSIPVNTTLSTPTLPNNAGATSFSETAINLTWDDNLTNEYGYKIERCAGVDCTDYTLINTLQSSFSDNFENDFLLSAVYTQNPNTTPVDYDPPIYSADAYATARTYWANDSTGHFAFTTTGTDPLWSVAVANIALVNPMRLGTGDFDIQTTYTVNGTAALDQNMAYIAFWSPGNYLPVARNRYGYAVSWQAKGNDSNASITDKPIVLGAEEKLRLTRQSNVITAYYWENGSWQTLKQYTTLMDSSLIPSVINLSGTAYRQNVNNWDTKFSQLKIISPTVTYYDFGADIKLQYWIPAGYIAGADANDVAASDYVAPIDISNGHGSSKVYWDNGKIVMHTTSTKDDYSSNNSTLQLKDATALLGSGDFDIQMDYNIPSLTTSTQTVYYARFKVDFYLPSGSTDTFFIDRRNSTEHYAQIKINGVVESASLYNDQSSSGKLRLVRSNNYLSAYSWINNEWKLVKTHSQQIDSSKTVSAQFTRQWAYRTDAQDVMIELDNFKLTKTNGLYKYSDTGMTTGVPYTYRVYPYREDGCTNWSDYATSTSVTPAVIAPTGLSTTNVMTTEVHLTWVDTASSETGFELNRCTGANCDFSGNDTVTFTVGANVNSYSDLTPMASTVYSYRVRAVNNEIPWTSDYSTTLADITTLTPQAPTNLAVTWGSEIRLNLAWTDNSPDETNFKVERGNESCGPSSFIVKATLPAGTTSYRDNDSGTGLSYNTTYCYRVRAYKNTGLANTWYSDYTNTDNDSTLVTPPPDLVAETANTTQIKLFWSDKAESETGYRIERCLGASCEPTFLTNVGANSTYYLDSSVCDTYTYRYRVQPIKVVNSIDVWDADPMNNYSNTSSTTTRTPYAPFDFTVSEIHNDSSESKQLQLYWEYNNIDETGFRIEKCTGANCSNFSTLSTMAAIQSNDTFMTAIDSSTYWTIGGEIQWNGGPDSDWSRPINLSNSRGAIKVTGSGNSKVELYAQTIPNSVDTGNLWTQAIMKMANPSIVGSSDFDIQVIFNLPYGLVSQVNDHRYLRMWLSFPDGDGNQRMNYDYAYIEYKINTNGTHSYYTYGRINNINQSATSATVTDTKGRLRIVRNNGYIYTYYWNNTTSQWVQLMKHGTALTFGLAPNNVQLYNLAQNIYNAPVTLRTEVEDFKIFKSSYSYTDTNLSSSSTYSYRVVPYKNSTSCEWEAQPGDARHASLYTAVSTERTRPTAPTALSATVVKHTLIELQWTDNDQDEDGYEIEKLMWNGYYQKIHTTYDRDTVYADNTRSFITSIGNEPGKSYTYRIRAYRGADYSKYSATASATTENYTTQADYDTCPPQ